MLEIILCLLACWSAACRQRQTRDQCGIGGFATIGVQTRRPNIIVEVWVCTIGSIRQDRDDLIDNLR